MNLSIKCKEIKKYAQFGLVIMSKHCRERAKERGILESDIYKLLCNSSASICQYHEEYKKNKNRTYVMWSKLGKKTYHIIIEETRSALNAPIYKILTIYEPSSQYFVAKGRFLKPMNKRYKSIDERGC